ncbi:hypothetical protein GCM10027020_22690 [Nocardioides salsibiostraticola]
MMGYGYDMGAGGWIAMTIFWIAVVVLIVWTVSRATSTGGAGSDLRRGVTRDDVAGTPEEILNRRFAAGEVDEATYHSMLATLRSPRTESR